MDRAGGVEPFAVRPGPAPGDSAGVPGWHADRGAVVPRPAGLPPRHRLPRLADADRPGALAGRRSRGTRETLLGLPGRDAARGRTRGRSRSSPARTTTTTPWSGSSSTTASTWSCPASCSSRRTARAGPGDHRPARPRQLQGEHLHRPESSQLIGPMLVRARLRRRRHRRLLQRRARRQGAGRPQARQGAPTRRRLSLFKLYLWQGRTSGA